jgi:large subunit ribosomal protein L18
MARTTRELRIRRHARIRRRLAGTAERPRVAVSRTNKHISAQIIDDVAGRTLAAASSVEPALKGATGGNIEGAKAVATVLAERARAASITAVVFDRGGFDYHGRVAAFADALRASGLEF